MTDGPAGGGIGFFVFVQLPHARGHDPAMIWQQCSMAFQSSVATRRPYHT
jgi:hypothetical protein